MTYHDVLAADEALVRRALELAVIAPRTGDVPVGAVVVGADQDTILELAQQLLTAEDAGTGDGG